MTRALGAGLAAGALWGIVFVAPRLLPGFTAFEVTLGRYVAYGVVCALVASFTWRSFRSVLSRRHVAMALLLAALSNSVYYVLLVLAVRDAGVAFTGLVIGTIPLWLALLGRYEAHVAHPPLVRLVAPLLLIATGVVLINAAALQSGALQGARFAFGALAAVGALVCWTVYPWLNARYLKRHPSLDNVAWTNLLGLATLAGLAACLPLTGLVETLPTRAADAAGPAGSRDWPVFVFWSAVMGIGSSWLATWLWNHASARLPVALSAQLIVAETLFALLYGFVQEQRAPQPGEWLAIAAFVAGILGAVRAYRAR
jgi:drug/metabolite transporter (DMT)-like permease